MTRRRPLLAAAAGLAMFSTAPAQAEQSQTQRFFSERLQAGKANSREVRQLLRTGQAFVDGAVVFKDLTGDRKADAMVRVQSGGVAGAIAVYVFSTDAGVAKNGPLRVVYRGENLLRAQTRIRDGVLRYRTSVPAAGEEPCCPSKVVERRLRWREARHRLTTVERREIGPSEPWGDQLAP